MRYRGEIDGLRALAVLSVVFFHYDVVGVPGGYVGVDVFFVIAGFLIASSLKAEVTAGTFSFLVFCERRVRRLLPALLVMLAAVLVAGFFLQRPADFVYLSRSGAFASVSSANLFFFLDSDRFNASVDTLPLLHTWTLGVEMQFYILLPVLIVLLRKMGQAATLAIIGGLAAASFAWSLWYLKVSQTGGFYMLPSRAWELLAGSLLAFAPRPRLNTMLASAIGLGGLALILFAVVHYNEWMFFPGKKGLVPVLGAMAVIFAANVGDRFTARLLAWKPVAYVGKVSYGWFLWHWPVISFYKYLGLDDGSLWPKLLLMAVSFGLAVASWQFVERPFMQRNPHGRPLRSVLIGVGASVALAAAFAFIVQMNGFPERAEVENNSAAAGTR